MGFGFGAGAAGLNIGDQIAGNTPGETSEAVYRPHHYPPRPGGGWAFGDLWDGISNVANAFGNIVTAGASILPELDDYLIAQAAARLAPRPRPRRRVAAPDPYAGVLQAMQEPVTPRKTSRKEQEKAINAAILAARQPFDQAIHESRAGLKQALAVNQRLVKEAMPNTGGTEERDAAYRAQVAAEADRMAAQAAADNAAGNAMAGGEAGDRAAQADDATAAMARAQAAALQEKSRMQTMGAQQVVSGLGDFLRANESETRQQLVRDSQRGVQRMQRERAAAIAEARAAAKAGIVEGDTNATIAMSEARQRQLDNVLKVMQLQQQARDAAANREIRSREVAAKTQLSPKDAFDLITSMIGKSVRVTDKKGNDGYTPAFPIGDPIAQAIFQEITKRGNIGNPFAPQPRDIGAELGGFINMIRGVL